MDPRDVIWLSLKDLNEKRIRTALTIIMVVIGVAAIVALTSLTAGISKSISGSLSTLGPTSIIISPAGTKTLTAADVSMLSSLPNVTSVTPVIEGSATLYSGSQNASVTLIGVSAAGMAHILGGNASLYQGAVYSDSVTPSALIGYSIAFPSSSGGVQEVMPGQPATLKVLGRSSETVAIPIIGVLQSVSSFIIPVNTGVFVPMPAAELLLHRTSYSAILVTASNISSVNATSSLISTIYGKGADVITTSQLLSTVASITGSLGLLFGAIAGVSLLVAAIGIMNIMLIAVYERTHEIGILKSLGFKNRHILQVFLFQAMIIGLIGGIIGVGLGAGAAFGLAAALSGGSGNAHAGATQSTAGAGSAPRGGVIVGSRPGSSSSSASTGSSLSFQPIFPVATIIYALLIAVLVSVAAGVYPAWRASKMEPIDALREL